ncbi:MULTISPECIES: fumarylacetoacetate hydrolase family protein [Sphingomonas]|jgi:2,4-diketo-3-deoxy-L-fuconate hydrolase|uniref:2-hydroxyhepta-2,4-diene-1,7-dioate isomerase n=1 Tax=Sphingomonas turrisvirgatae TaxID=1888892 RepID=A0A1E3LS51_9SPHN|nr:fumarylacetoacetate hydrolase family protein [Sphingomonas turrisvirgatae]ODP36578.1 2-hydroxyhepta-2,4-diene-1,7-dioate isomerase [Sphingomonas turrisvirgatae]
MRFLRVDMGGGRVVPCILDADGSARDISTLVPDLGPGTLGDALIERIAATEITSLPLVDLTGRRIDAPMAQPGTIWCIGLNYSDHAAEAGMAIPKEPILFNKAAVTYCGPNDPILMSPQMTKLDWEVELGIVIGKAALNVSPDAALEYVFGYVLVNDVSERAWQMEREGQWVKGKSFPNFCPVGPHLVTRQAVDDVQSLSMWLDVNGERKQTGSTSRMIFDVATIVSYMSEFTRLETGDLICTGTPPGVGAGMKPPQWLKAGDCVTLGIEGLDEQAQTVEPLA